MKNVAALGLLILVAGIAVGGSSVYAQDDPAMLLIAKRAQDQIQSQISSDLPEEIKMLLQQGTAEVAALEQSLENGDADSAKEHFFSAMKIFKQVSRHLVASEESGAAPQAESVAGPAAKDPSNDLERLQVYANSLKNITAKYNTTTDFSEADRLFAKAAGQIDGNQLEASMETLHEIRAAIAQISGELREEASKQESQRAQEYAQKYLEKLDRLIEHAKNQAVPDEIIGELEAARDRLSSTDDPRKIAEEIRKIMSIKDRFELTKNDVLESKVFKAEKRIFMLSQADGADPDALASANETLREIKRHISDGQPDAAAELLRELAGQLQEIRDSLTP